MSLLSDFVNDRFEPMHRTGVVNGVLNLHVPDDVAVESDKESDSEQVEYVEQEMNTYFTSPKTIAGLTDIVDIDVESTIGSELCQLVNVPVAFTKYKFDSYFKKELPIDSFRDKIMDLIKTNSVVIIHGPTGCGKTTQVPQYILDHCKAKKAPCNIVITQPRRIAAINLSQRVCEERGWGLGTVCGYQVGLNKNVGDDVVLTYMTTEVLLQKLIVQRNLNKYTHIIIDEIHERNKTLDFLLLIVRKYLFTNSPTVKVVLMSATMEAKTFAFYFRSIPRNIATEYLPAPVLHVDKKSEYTTNIYYIDQFPNFSTIPHFDISDPGIPPEIYKSCANLIYIFDNLDDVNPVTSTKVLGSVLVFLPGLHEIEEMHKLLEDTSYPHTPWEIVPMHSSLSSDHLIRAFQKPKPGIRKVILSTNIAESSVTVPDVHYVIDFCLTKLMTINKASKFSTLALEWASHNNCIQRAGRVGRVANGRVYRLVTEEFYKYEMLPATLPELQRAPLENIILYMKLLDLNDTPKNVLSLAVDPPDLKDVESCIWHLKEAGGLLQTCRGNPSSADGDITFLGKVMGTLPIDIHLAKLIILGHMFSCLHQTVIMAAGATTRNLFVKTFRERLHCYKKKLLWADGSCSDLIALLNLYNVWQNQKKEHAFRTINEEYSWCRTNLVNLKGLREWDILAKEIFKRLKQFRIEPPTGAEKVRLSPLELPLVLKVVICGAFYPNYFIRSSEFGQVDAREAVKILGGRDPYNTVYFTNMRPNQPGQIYVRQIKDMLNTTSNVSIGFDRDSSKIYVEFKNNKGPETVNLNGVQYITTIPGNISMDVYESVRKRQLRTRFCLEILSDAKAWEFAKLTEEKRKALSETQEVHCFSAINYNPLPTLDIEYMTVIITERIDAGHFYCQHFNDETTELLNGIFSVLNGPGTVLEPITEKVQVDSKFYAAMYLKDRRYYRCKVLFVTQEPINQAHVQFIDYGNVQKVPINKLCELPNHEICSIHPIAMCCVLSEVQPCLVFNPKALWSQEVNEQFDRKTQGVLLQAKVYSVVDDVVHLELYLQLPSTNGENTSFNEWLIRKGHAQKCEESYLSKLDHEKRLQVLQSENPSTEAVNLNVSAVNRYSDFESPEMGDTTYTVELKGPYNPLEMKICGMVQATSGASINFEEDSVNTVLLDDNPEDPHNRLIVAGVVAQSAFSQSIKISQTTIMPSIPGLPMIMLLMFCPTMEPKVNDDGSRVTAILCGLGAKDTTNKPYFAMHDIPYVLDTELNEDIIVKINELRYTMDRAVKIMSNIYDELTYANELNVFQQGLKKRLFTLLHLKQKPATKQTVKDPDMWNTAPHESVSRMAMSTPVESDNIWPVLGYVKLKDEKIAGLSISRNLEELNEIAKRLVPEKQIVCQLCSSDVLYSLSDVRIHLFREEHKNNFAQFKTKIGKE